MRDDGIGDRFGAGYLSGADFAQGRGMGGGQSDGVSELGRAEAQQPTHHRGRRHSGHGNVIPGRVRIGQIQHPAVNLVSEPNGTHEVEAAAVGDFGSRDRSAQIVARMPRLSRAIVAIVPVQRPDEDAVHQRRRGECGSPA